MIDKRTYYLHKNICLKIALVSDLHDANGEEVIAVLKKDPPDLIVSSGDLFERTDRKIRKELGIERECPDDTTRRVREFVYWILKFYPRCLSYKDDQSQENGYHFIEEAVKIAPLFMSVGNHEKYFFAEDLKVIEENHAVLLDNQDLVIDIHGQKLRIGGLSSILDLEWLEEFKAKDGFKILINHHPEYYEKYIGKDSFDLVLSGHAHGGQWKFHGKPVFAPAQGFFPKYAYGLYDECMVVSAGLCNTLPFPRFHNPKEIVYICLEL